MKKRIDGRTLDKMGGIMYVCGQGHEVGVGSVDDCTRVKRYTAS